MTLSPLSIITSHDISTTGARRRTVRESAKVAAILGVAAVVAAVGVAASLTSDAPPGARLRFAVMDALIVLIPVGVGVYATRYEPHRRFGRQLIAAGLLWSTATLAQSDASLPYSVGRVGGWIVVLALICLLLSYPTGRITRRFERGILAADLVVLCGMFLPTALLVEAYPRQTPWTLCSDDCPANAFMLVDTQPGFLDTWLFPVREAALVLLFAATVAVVVARVRRSTSIQRRTRLPILLTFGIQTSCLVAFLLVRRADPGAPAVDTLGWVYALCVPLVALGFLTGLVRWRVYVAGALQRLTLATRAAGPSRDLRETLSECIDDPSLEVAIRRDGGWFEPTGRPRDAPSPHAGQALTEVRDDDQLVAALVHDGALAEDHEFASAVAACTVTLLERQSMLATVTTGLRELDEVRSRLLAEVDDERRRMERDLHDGVQQRLVVLGIKLGMANDRLTDGDAADPAVLRGLEGEVFEIVDEIRSLARGVHPSLLADRGLRDALVSVTERSPLPVELDAVGVGRHSDEVETAVYFACIEALQNVVKHAGASRARITLRDNGALTFEVDDDGVGLAPGMHGTGSGVVNMRDRLAEVGGTLTIESTPGHGTRVVGEVPHVHGARAT